MLQEFIIFLSIGSPDIQLKLPLLGILWNCLIQHPGFWFLHQLYVWRFSFSSRPELELHILGSEHSWKKLSSLPSGKLDLQNKQCRKFSFRVPLIINQAARFNFGFASNMVLLLWCICGGLLAHMLEANFLTILLTPVYEKSIETAEDVLDRGMSVIFPPQSESMRESLMNSPSYITRWKNNSSKSIILLYWKISF